MIARNPDTFRNRVRFSWRSKEEAINAVAEGMKCSSAEARKLFESAARSTAREPILVYDKGSDTWATTNADKHSNPHRPPRTRTAKQQRFWDVLATIPGWTNGKEPQQSELYRNLVERGDFPDIESVRKFWKGAQRGSASEVEELISFYMVKDQIFGKNYYRPGTIRDARQLSCEEMVDAVRSYYPRLIGVSPAKLSGFEPDVIVRKAIWCGDLLMVNFGKDPFAANSGDVLGICNLIGADTYTRQEKEKAEELARISADRAIAAKKEERMKARTAELDARALAASEAGVKGFERFWDKVGDYALENGIAFEAVHRLYIMHLFQNGIEIGSAFNFENGLDFQGIAKVFKRADRYVQKRDQDCIDFMVECGLLVQTTEYDEVYKCDRIAYHGSALTFEEARQLRNDLKAE